MQRFLTFPTSLVTSRALSQPRVRLAEPQDAVEVTKVFINAMQDDQSWPYRFPHREEFPDDHWNYNLDLMSRFISPDYDDWVVVVAEADDSRAGADVRRIVSFAVWNISYANKRRRGSSYVPNSREHLHLSLPN